MRSLIVPLIVVSSLGLNGCVSWAIKGMGGMAEQKPTKVAAVEVGKPLGPEHGLHFELELVKRHLDVLVLEGAELCFPATVVQAKERQTRITRELHGGLKHDAANDLVVQRELLQRLENQLDYVKRGGACVPGRGKGAGQAQKSPGDFGKRLHMLFNSDNQFASGSSELNPKYFGRLAEAANLLRDRGDITLRIVGHADAKGERETNQMLSLERAKKVARYLQILGLDAERIQVDAVGENDPLMVGRESNNRLVNRRVTIELIESVSTASVERRG